MKIKPGFPGFFVSIKSVQLNIACESIADFATRLFAVPRDAREPVQFVAFSRKVRLGVFPAVMGIWKIRLRLPCLLKWAMQSNSYL